MALELQDGTLNESPYFDDFAEDKNFHRVLFRPGVAVQARELTQLQTILQNQIERFGENIYKTGTVIKGCTQSFDSNYQYVKILDNQVDGQPCNMSLYANTLVVGTANLRAYSVNAVTGLQTQNPDLNTLYIKYLNTGTSGEKTFASDDVLTIYHRDRRVESITVLQGGSGYSNTDTVTFTAAGTGGSGAVGTIVTYANGTIKEVLLNEKGSGYVDVPTVTPVGTSAGQGAQLTATIQIAQLTVAGNFYTAPVGAGYAVRVSDGIIFQKGHFVRFEGGTAIAAKYSTAPNNAVIGFSTTEAIVNATSDDSLLDNSTGSLNYKAPGAHRLKLTPTLVVKTKQEASSNNSFFGIVEFENGHKVRQSEDTQYNVIGNQMAKRTYEQSGNYVVSRFPVITEPISGNTTHINVAVGAGTGYVDGFRVENLDNIRVPLRKATDVTTDYGQSISTNYGNYVLVQEMAGSFEASAGVSVSLRSAAGQNLTTNVNGTPNGSSAGSQIGTAKVRAVVYESGDVGTPTCQYRLYLFDIQMSAGKTFGDVRAISVAGVACADVVLNALSKAELLEPGYSSLVFNLGTQAIKQLNNENFIYRATVSSQDRFSTSGVATIELAGDEEFPYTPSSTLNNTQERDFVIIPTNSTYGGTKAGTVQTFGNTTIQANTGSTTTFLTDYNAGESIYIGGNYRVITRVISDTRLEVSSSIGAGTSQAHRIGFPAYVPVNTFKRVGAGITIDSTGTIATINLGTTVGTLNTEMDAVIHYNSKVAGGNIQVGAHVTKGITKNAYVKISGAQLATNPNGPWCLGLPDVHKIVGVYKGTNTTYNETTDITSSFELDNGQTDNLYGLAFLNKKSGIGTILSSTDNLLIKLDVYTRSSTGYYISAESYPVDDATVTLPGNKIRTQEIELFNSSAAGKLFDLRDCIDFRPAAANTAAISTTIAGATINPTYSTTLSSGTKYFPSPNQTFQADILSYMPRMDRVTLDSTGQIRIAEGTPSNRPSAPVEPLGSMTLAIVSVPPYPTLAQSEARNYKRPDLITSVSLQQQRRYTMKDIQDIEGRIARLEYYSLLNTLEQQTKNIVIPSELDATIDRFKHGFFVDPFDDYNIANVNDPEYRMFIDVYNSEARPVINQYDVELEYAASKNTANTTLTGDLVSLAYTEIPFVAQPFATKVRNCVENAYNYKGKLFTFPQYDNQPDTKVSPQTIDVDLAGALDPLVSSINDAFDSLGGKVTITNTSTAENLLRTSSSRGNGGITTTNVFDQTITSTGTLTKQSISATQGTTTEKIGDYVTNFSLQPYIRSQAIKVVAVGLRPGARHYVWFDKRDVSSFCQPATVSSTTTFSEDGFFVKGAVGDALYATEQGVVSCVLYLPAATFQVGEREIIVLDVDNIESQTAAVSKAIGAFSAYNFSVEKQALSLNTKTFSSVKMTEEITPYTSTTRGTVTRTSFVAIPPSDPIAQSFKVQGPDKGVDGVVATSIDLYFSRKDAAQGVVVEIRTVNYGIPTTTVLPNAVARLPASMVNVSDDASVKTTFTFDSPVYLKADTEYAFVVYPEAGSPEYLLWTGEAGGIDVTDPTLVKKSDWGLGAMFLSTNGSTWSAYQFEDVKFTLNRAKFTSTSATATLTPNAYEFLKIQGLVGSFTPGEVVAQKALSYGTGIVYANTSSRVLNGLNSAFTTYVSLNDRILITYGTNKTVARQGYVSGGTSSGTITGTGTQFLTDYAVGDYVQIGNYIRQVETVSSDTSMAVSGALGEVLSGASHYGIDPAFCVAKVLNIGSSTQITLDTYPPLNSGPTDSIIANYQKVVSGIVSNHNTSTGMLTIKQSTAANSNFRFATGRGVVGSISQAQATITSVEDVNVSYIEPHVQTFIPPATTTTFDLQVMRSSNNQIVSISGQQGTANRIPFTAKLRSRSNEITGTAIDDSLIFLQNINTAEEALSPLVDVNPGSIVIIENIIDNYTAFTQTANTFSNTLLQTTTTNVTLGMGVQGLGIAEGTIVTGINGANVTLSIAAARTVDSGTVRFTSNDNKRYGISKNRYISKRLALSDGMDAEDLRVLITAYKPDSTDVEVYAKILNGVDGDVFNDKDWSKLVQVTNNGLYSDSLNPNDYREFEYTFDSSPPAVNITGTGRTDVSVNASNTTLEGFGTEFDSQLSVGDTIKLIRTTDNELYDVRRIASITDYNTIVLNQAPSFTADGIVLQKVLEPYTAFKYKHNDGIVRYYNDAGAYFDGYKYMAIKIVLRAATSAVVPTVQDIRAIAISV